MANTKFKLVCTRCGSDNVIVKGDCDNGNNQDGSWFNEVQDSYWCTIKCLNCGESYCGLEECK